MNTRTSTPQKAANPLKGGVHLRAARAVGRLLAGLAAVTGCGAAFAALTDSVREGDGITVWDRPLDAAIAAHRTAALTDAATAITRVGNTLSLITITTLAALVLAVWSRRWRPVWLAAAALAGSSAAVAVIKVVVGRSRPDRSLAALFADGYSFPSGHTTNSLAAFGILAFLAATTVMTGRRAQAVVWVAACGAAVAIGLSRVYLGVHYLTDVLAGWTLASGWLLLIVAVDTLWRRRGDRTGTNLAEPARLGD
jgi:membrane-associated phospholipid phosphatase